MRLAAGGAQSWSGDRTAASPDPKRWMRSDGGRRTHVHAGDALGARGRRRHRRRKLHGACAPIGPDGMELAEEDLGENRFRIFPPRLGEHVRARPTGPWAPGDSSESLGGRPQPAPWRPAGAGLHGGGSWTPCRRTRCAVRSSPAPTVSGRTSRAVLAEAGYYRNLFSPRPSSASSLPSGPMPDCGRKYASAVKLPAPVAAFDDDPTGTQSVAGVHVLHRPHPEDLDRLLGSGDARSIS